MDPSNRSFVNIFGQDGISGTGNATQMETAHAVDYDETVKENLTKMMSSTMNLFHDY